MFSIKFNIWFLSSILISLLVIIPILTVSVSFFEETSRYFEILKDTFLFEYIFNSFTLLFCVLILTFIIGVHLHTMVSFLNFLLGISLNGALYYLLQFLLIYMHILYLLFLIIMEQHLQY